MTQKMFPVETEVYGNGKLLVVKLEDGAQGNCIDYLIKRDENYFLLVQENVRFRQLVRQLGNKPDTRVVSRMVKQEEIVPVEILRNHPIQYAARRMTTLSDSVYGVTEDLKFTGRESLEGRDIYRISGLHERFTPTAKRYIFTGETEEFSRLLDEEGIPITPQSIRRDYIRLAVVTEPTETGKKRLPFISNILTDFI
jgi:hypothetical protein